jgi:hypothetical protein
MSNRCSLEKFKQRNRMASMYYDYCRTGSNTDNGFKGRPEMQPGVVEERSLTQDESM